MNDFVTPVAGGRGRSYRSCGRAVDVVGTLTAMPATDVGDRVRGIEEAFVAHWSNFGRWSHGRLRDEDGVLWFETPIRYLPYNMVIRSRITPAAESDAVIDRVVAEFVRRDVPYLWMVRPSDRPADLDHRLARRGLELVETATGMDMDLADWHAEESTSDGRILQVDDDPAGLGDYVELIRTYWSLPESEREMLAVLNRDLAGARSPGVRVVAYLDDAPVGKAFMNTTELPARVAVYGVAVRPEARGRGIATSLMNELLSRARKLGGERCVLHSSSMAVSLYRRMGFVERCTFGVWATGPLFGTHQH
jgi:ribosomal protein S18 acetylase RimI-like enzyme